MEKLNKLMFSNALKIGMLEDMSELLAEGMSVVEIAEDFERYGSGAVSKLGTRMLESVGSGRPVSLAFEGYMNDITVQTMLAGEMAQDLRGGCISAVTAINNTGGVVGLLIKSISFPMIQLSAITFIVVLLSNEIFPILEGLIAQFLWPAMSRSFYGFITGISENVWVILGSIVGVPYAFRLFMENVTGAVRDQLDKLPLFTQYRYVVASQVMYTMSTILKSGGSMVEAIEFAGRGVSKYQKEVVERVNRKLTQARSPAVGELLDINLLNERQLNRLKVMSNSSRGNAQRLLRCADAHTSLIEFQVDIFAKSLKSLVMAFSVLLLLGMLGSIMLLVMQAKNSIA